MRFIGNHPVLYYYLDDVEVLFKKSGEGPSPFGQ